MERENANSKYKWDLTNLYKSNKEWQDDYNYVLNNYKKLEDFKGKFSNKQCLLDFLKQDKQIGIILSKLAYYSYLSHDIDLSNPTYVEQLGLVENLESSYASSISFAMPELNSMSTQQLTDFLNDTDFQDNTNLFKDILNSRKHLLSDKEENIMGLVSSFTGGFSRIYDELTETDLTLRPIIINNKEQPLTTENYSLYITDENRDVRKQAYDNLYEKYAEISHTTAMSYIYYLKSTAFDLKLRKYDSLLQETLHSAQIDEKVYYNLIENVNNNVNIMHKYYSLLGKSKNIKDMKFYDTYLSIANNSQKTYSVEEQFSIVKNALSVLGSDYLSNLDFTFNNNCIDFYSSKNKSSGGYNFCIYGQKPHIFLNDNGNYNSLSTLAHELGHAMHSIYTNKTQCYEKANIAIFIAEIASTVNEILLNKYLQKNATTKQEKLFLLDQFVKNTKATVFRQTMFSEFEDYAHKLVENNKPISVNILNDKYKCLLKKHFGETVQIDDKIQYEWSRISHFFRSYYVYKYATSYVCANFIATKILNGQDGMLEKYLTLLKSGNSDYPTNLLKIVDIDLTKNDVYNIMFNDLNTAINQIEDLINDN